MASAITFDATATSSTTATSLTYSHTCAAGSASSGILWVSVLLGTDASSNKISGVTYNGVAMTNTNTPSGDGASTLYLFYLVGPATGANNIVITRTDGFLIIGNSASYLSSKQTGIPDAIVANNGSNGGSPLNIPLTTVADNCWMVLTAFDASATLTISSNGTARQGSGTTRIFGDTNAAQTPAGAKTIQVSQTAGQTIYWIVASFAPLPPINLTILDTQASTDTVTLGQGMTILDTQASTDTVKIRQGFGNQTKSSTTWTNQTKS